jgi:hypothetical protein
MQSVRRTDSCTSPCFTDWLGEVASFAFSLACVRFCSEYFGWARSRSDDEPCGGYALHYKSSYERNFIARIFVQRGLTVHSCIWTKVFYSDDCIITIVETRFGHGPIFLWTTNISNICISEKVSFSSEVNNLHSSDIYFHIFTAKAASVRPLQLRPYFPDVLQPDVLLDIMGCWHVGLRTTKSRLFYPSVHCIL